MHQHSNCYLQIQEPLICSGELGSEMETQEQYEKKKKQKIPLFCFF